MIIDNFMQNTSQITTNRLQLYLMGLPLLQAIADGNHELAQTFVNYKLPLECLLLKNPRVNKRIKMIENDIDQHPWMYRSIVRISDNIMVGYISFHHKAPDPDLIHCSAMAVELGYAIEPEFRRMGYAKESVIGMMNWALSKYGINDYFLTISPNNTPSLALAESLRFSIIGQRIDETDGLEYIMRKNIISAQ